MAGAGRNDFAGRCVVEIDGDAAEQHERVVGERSANGWRQQHADHMLLTDLVAQSARDVHCLGERGAERHFRRFSICHHEAQWMASGGAHECAIERLHAALAALECLGVQLLHCAAHLDGR